jgi:regulator of protease activity HflC (stomatin/prohibitin superfamily)
MKISTIVKLASSTLSVLIGFIVLLMWGCPRYHVYEQEKTGEATFARASKDREVKVLEAQAKLDSAKLEALAEIERAKGVAGANAIIADGLKGHEEYLRYLWIDKVAGSTSREVVYIPTEANMPILEARPHLEVKP